jgi:hypothetical protein
VRLCLDRQGVLGDAGHVVAVACSEVGIRQALRVCASTPREFLEMVEEQCNFLSKDFSNSSAFSWAYTLSRVFSEWEYTNPAGPTIADHRVVLLRLLVAGLPMAGAYASVSLRPSARATRERGGGPPTGFWSSGVMILQRVPRQSQRCLEVRAAGAATGHRLASSLSQRGW